LENALAALRTAERLQQRQRTLQDLILAP